MNTHEIVQAFLEANPAQYDGLVERDGMCACLTKDLAPCGELQHDCIAGHKGDPIPDQYCDSCPCTWHIFPGPRKEEVE